MPLLLLLILGAMDFGRMFYTKLVLTNAAREGANYLAYHPDEADFAKEVAVAEAFSLGMTIGTSNITITDCCTEGQPITVTATNTANLIFGGFFQAIGLLETGTIELEGSSRMMVQF